MFSDFYNSRRFDNFKIQLIKVMNRPFSFLLFFAVVLLLAGCAAVPAVRPGDVVDYDTFTSAFTSAFAEGRTEDGLFMKTKFTQWYSQMIEKITLVLVDPGASKLEREAATELFYWAESLGRIKEYKEIK